MTRGEWLAPRLCLRVNHLGIALQWYRGPIPKWGIGFWWPVKANRDTNRRFFFWGRRG